MLQMILPQKPEETEYFWSQKILCFHCIRNEQRIFWVIKLVEGLSS